MQVWEERIGTLDFVGTLYHKFPKRGYEAVILPQVWFGPPLYPLQVRFGIKNRNMEWFEVVENPANIVGTFTDVEIINRFTIKIRYQLEPGKHHSVVFRSNEVQNHTRELSITWR